DLGPSEHSGGRLRDACRRSHGTHGRRQRDDQPNPLQPSGRGDEVIDVVSAELSPREDIAHIVQNLRARDRAEIFGLRWDDDEEALIDSVFAVAGPMWRVWSYQGEPVAMNGIVPQRPGVVTAGAFGTDKFNRVIRPMIRWSRDWVIPRLKSA